MGDEEAARSGGLRYLSYLLHFAAGKQSCQDTAWPAIRVRQEFSVGRKGVAELSVLADQAFDTSHSDVIFFAPSGNRTQKSPPRNAWSISLCGGEATPGCVAARLVPLGAQNSGSPMRQPRISDRIEPTGPESPRDTSSSVTHLLKSSTPKGVLSTSPDVE